MLSDPLTAIVFSAVVIATYGALWKIHSKHRDGVGKQYLMISFWTIIGFFIIRLISYCLYYSEHLSIEYLRQILANSQIIFLIPAIFVIWYEYRRKQ